MAKSSNSIDQRTFDKLRRLYIIGFFMITPEFSLYMEFWNIVLIDTSYIVIGIILFIVIRKGVIKEMQKLTDIVQLKNEITE